ncbi:glycosyltransferase family 2 protein [Thiomicrorhabdus sediminis]|nr:glycosyltransferase [Thiomicrorhabdus sediminis]
MPSSPLVSVLIPSYNHGGFIKEAIVSVINQSYKNIELIIIDDGSLDNSVDVINEMLEQCESRFVNFQLIARANKGLSATLNEGLNRSKGKYFTSLASDDVFLPNKVEQQVNVMEANPYIDMLFGGMQVIDDSSLVLKTYNVPERVYEFNDFILQDYFLPSVTLMYRLDRVLSIGGYEDNIAVDDWYMWLKASSAGLKLKSVPQVFSQYRRHENNFSKQAEAMWRSKLLILASYKQHPLYELAVSISKIIYAGELIKLSRRKALKVFWNALKKHPSLIRHRRFYVFWIKFFLPKSKLRAL